jgi:hypothetical protein
MGSKDYLDLPSWYHFAESFQMIEKDIGMSQKSRMSIL